MRRACSGIVTLLAMCAVPPIDGAQQAVTVFDNTPHDRQRLEHPVPVATVSRVGDIVALGDARIVPNPPGEPFVVGAATLNVSDPSHPRIGFTMTNTTPQPVDLSAVFVEANTMGADIQGNIRPLGGLSGLAGSPSGTEQLQPGATITVAMPIPPMAVSACYLDDKYGKRWGFLVLVGEYPGPASNGVDREQRSWKLLNKAFLMLVSEASR